MRVAASCVIFVLMEIFFLSSYVLQSLFKIIYNKHVFDIKLLVSTFFTIAYLRTK